MRMYCPIKTRYTKYVMSLPYNSTMQKQFKSGLTSWKVLLLTLRAGFASGWKTERALIAFTSTPIGCASWGIDCMISYKTNVRWYHDSVILITPNFIKGTGEQQHISPLHAQHKKSCKWLQNKYKPFWKIKSEILRKNM